VEFERICGVAVGHFCVEVGGQVDDVDGSKRTFFGTDTTSLILV